MTIEDCGFCGGIGCESCLKSGLKSFTAEDVEKIRKEARAAFVSIDSALRGIKEALRKMGTHLTLIQGGKK